MSECIVSSNKNKTTVIEDAEDSKKHPPLFLQAPPVAI